MSCTCCAQLTRAQFVTKGTYNDFVKAITKALKDSAAKIRSEYVSADAGTLATAKDNTGKQINAAFSSLQFLDILNNAIELYLKNNGYLKTADLPGQLTTLGISKDKLLVFNPDHFIVTVTAGPVIDTVRIKRK
jgi:hypothetical protein